MGIVIIFANPTVREDLRSLEEIKKALDEKTINLANCKLGTDKGDIDARRFRQQKHRLIKCLSDILSKNPEYEEIWLEMNTKENS